MKRIVTLLFLLNAFLCFSYAQVYSYDLKTDNFRQIDETTMQWELHLKKGEGSADFPLWSMQIRWSYNKLQIDNGGAFDNVYYTIEPGADATAHNSFFQSADATLNSSLFQWGVTSPANVGENMTVITGTWKHIATFTAQLRKNGLPHNFKDGAISFAHESPGTQIFMSRPQNPVVPYDGSVNVDVPRNSIAPGLGIAIDTRQLAGYWFTGEGNWSETARWNNVTNENKNVVPPLATNNVGIAGQATLTDTRTVNQLTIAEEALLVLSGAAGNIGWLTVNGDLFNDNQTDENKNGSVTLAKWDFEDTGQTGLPYMADDGIVGNIGAASFATSANFAGFFEFGGGTRAPFAQSWYIAPQPPFIPDPTFQHWQVQFSTLGYKNLKISSVQYAVTGGPTSFKLEYSTDGSNWTDVPGSSITVAVDWSTGTISDFVLPNAFDNISVGYLRWTTTGVETGFGGIDNIIITGEALPPPPTGLLISSTADGTGSLIHNTADVEATIERYIPAAGYHLASVPFTQASNPRSGWFIWSYLYEYAVGTQAWESMGNATWTPLNVDQGYMVYKYPGPDKFSNDTTYAMTGLMNIGPFDMKVEYVGTVTNSFNLVPNPYPSAIDWNVAGGWTGRADFSGAYWMWKQGTGYATWNGSVSVPAGAVSKDIPVGQSFFVLAANADASLSVNNDARVHSTQVFHKNEGELYDLLRLKATTANGNDDLAIHFVDYATQAYDRKYDAIKMNRGADFPQLYSYSADGRKLTINSLPMTDETISITLGFDLSIAGEVTFEFTSLDSFDSDVTMFLWDMLTDTKVNLREKPDYTFMHHPDNNAARFALLFNSAVGIAESESDQVRLYAVDNNLYLHLPLEVSGECHIQLFDTGGRLVYSTTANSGATVINVPSLGNGIYIVRLISDQYSVAKKVFMK